MAIMAAEAEEPITLSAFEVSAIEDTGYAPSESLSGTKVRTNLREIPMNIQVVTAEFIEDIGAFDLQEALAYNAAVSVSDNAYQAQIRGFTSDWQLRNGFRYYKRTDTAKVARIERHGKIGCRAEQPIERSIGKPLGPRFLSLPPHGIDDVRSAPPGG